MVHYPSGGFYGPHWDTRYPRELVAFFMMLMYRKDEKREDNPQLILEGERIATFLMYLADSRNGGGTSFPKLNISVEARR